MRHRKAWQPSSAQNLVDGLSLGQLVNQLVEIPDVAHQRMFHVLHP